MSATEKSPDGQVGAAPPEFDIWEGVYSSFAEAPATGPGFAGPIWRERSLRAAEEALQAVKSGNPLDYSLRQRNALLPVLCAVLLSRKPRIRVLDFGGGLGTGFIVLLNALQDAATRVSYDVVELEEICAVGRELLRGHENLRFLPEFPSTGEFDLVFSASAIQYAADWQAVVRQLANYSAPYVAFGDCFVGDLESFVTSQNYYGSRIPHWFLNRGEFEAALTGEGYSLAMRADCDARILGQYGPIPMTNFPPERRLNHSSHMLFERRTRGE